MKSPKEKYMKTMQNIQYESEVIGYSKGIHATINAIVQRRCVYCLKYLDNDLGRNNWHIPLCSKHRDEEINRIAHKY